MQDLVVIDYGAGNLRSVAKALSYLGYAPQVTNDPAVVLEGRALVLPGVGAAGQIMRSLRKLELDEAVRSYIASGRPFLGVCMGMQVLMDWSEEDGGQTCLGVFPGTVRRLGARGQGPGARDRGPGAGQVNSDSPDPRPPIPNPRVGPQPPAPLKVPHMGWNAVRQECAHPVWAGIPDHSYFYFVHSYAVAPTGVGIVAGATDYGEIFPSALAHANVFGTQFHPEKSGRVGLQIYRNFVEWALGAAVRGSRSAAPQPTRHPERGMRSPYGV